MPPKVAYIISQYPEFHETFIAREVEALRSKGMPPRIFSLKTPSASERGLYQRHAEFVEYSAYLVSFAVVAANIAEALRHPWRYLAALWWILVNYGCHPFKLFKALAAFPKTVLYAREIRGRYDLLHAHWATIPTAMAVVVNILTGIRFSFTAHAWDIYVASRTLLAEKIARASGVVTCTGYNADYLRRVCRPEDRGKINLNYHGIDLVQFPFPDRQPPAVPPLRVIAIGRLVEQKGFVHLIRAVKILAGQGVPVQLTIVGDGPLCKALQEEADRGAENGAVTFAGQLPHGETIKQLQNSHIMVAPSVISTNGDRDGIPNVILEAMACGLPVVASGVSGIPEIVIDGKTGVLVPPGESEALASALATLWDQPGQASHFGSQGRQFIEKHFDVSRNVDELVTLLAGFASNQVSGGR